MLQNDLQGSDNSYCSFSTLEPTSASISKKLEPLRRQRGVARGVLNIATPEVQLDRPGIVAIIGELIAAGIAQHVVIGLDTEFGRGAGLQH
jgi:hypothetical protein